jgi:hypothetical protein
VTRIGKAKGTPTDRVRLDSRLGPVERRRPRPWRTAHVTLTEAPVGLGQAAAGETSATGRSVRRAPVVGSTGSVRRSVRRAARRSLPGHQRRGVGSRVEGMHRSGRSPDDRPPARSIAWRRVGHAGSSTSRSSAKGRIISSLAAPAEAPLAGSRPPTSRRSGNREGPSGARALTPRRGRTPHDRHLGAVSP